jgi:hypothetical protein
MSRTIEVLRKMIHTPPPRIDGGGRIKPLRTMVDGRWIDQLKDESLHDYTLRTLGLMRAGRKQVIESVRMRRKRVAKTLMGLEDTI